MNSGHFISQTFQSNKSKAKVDPMSPEKTALPPIVDQQTWRAALDELRKREKAVTRGDWMRSPPNAAALPMVELPDYTLIGAGGPVRLVDVFDGRSAADRRPPHVVRRRGVAVQRMHGIYVAMRVAAVPSR